MQNRKRNSRRGWLKGIPKKRTVFGRLRVGQYGCGDGNPQVFIIEMRLGGIHVRKLRSIEPRRCIKLKELIAMSEIQPELVPSDDGNKMYGSREKPVRGYTSTDQERTGESVGGTAKSVRDSAGAADGKALSSSPRPISATGEGEPKQKRAVTKTKESKDIYGSIQKGTTEGSEGHPNP